MSFVSGLLGGSSGAGFQAVAPSSAQLGAANTGVTNSIQQQQDFVNALNGQNGLGNQSSVFGQQQGLANQLQNVANGAGPNPAQAMLAQATGANVANQASMMAGQRGSGANAGLMARQAAMQGANTQQQAAGQGATMQAQQSLGAMGQLQGQQANMANMANTQVGQRQAGLTGLNQNTLQQQANLYGLQSNANSANAGIAGQNAGAQAGMLGGLMNGAGGAMGSMFGGSSGATPTGTLDPSALSNGASVQDMVDSGFAQGGQVRMASGGQPMNGQVQALDQPTTQGPQSAVGKMFNDAGPSGNANQAKAGAGAGAMTSGMLKMGVNAIEGIAKNDVIHGIWNGLSGMASSIGGGASTMAGAGDAIAGGAPAAAEGLGTEAVMVAAKGGRVPMATGGKVPALVSPGEIRIHRKDVPAVAAGQKSPLSGEKIPGKPKVGGAKNDYANDTIPKSLNEGDIILPRSVTQSKNPHWAAHRFVSAIMAQNKHGKK